MARPFGRLPDGQEVAIHTLGSDDGRALAALPNPVLEKPFDLGRLERVLEDTAG